MRVIVIGAGGATRELLGRLGELWDVVVVDSALRGSHISGSPDYAYCSSNDDRSMLGQEVELQRISDKQEDEHPAGRWIGMLRVQKSGRAWLAEALNELKTRDSFGKAGMPDLLNYLVGQGKPVKVQYINGHWLDVNVLEDLERAGRFAKGLTE